MSKHNNEAIEDERLTEEETPQKQVDEQQKSDDANGEEAPKQKAETSGEEEALNVRFMRLSADFSNYKKRVEKEKSDIYRLANEKLLTDLLPVIDNMERALAHAEEGSKERFVEGVEMVYSSFLSVLKNAGLSEIEAEGLPFNHNVHHAVLTEASDSHESETITGVLQKGYMLNNKVIRPSMVKVAE